MGLGVLDPDENVAYGTWSLPCERDREIGDAVLWLVTHPGACEREYGAVLLAFAERMATLARRTDIGDYLRSGLLAAALASRVSDSRDVDMVLSLLYRTAEVLDLQIEDEFQTASDRVLASKAVVDFVKRDPADRSISAMGYVERSDEFGFHYERTW